MGKNTPKQLTDISERPDFIEIVRRGGQSKSLKRGLAQKQRWFLTKLARGVLTDNDLAWAAERTLEPGKFALDLIAHADKLEIDHPNSLSVLAIKNQIGRFIHGDKLRTENVNINIDLSSEIENLWKKRIEKQAVEAKEVVEAEEDQEKPKEPDTSPNLNDQ